MALMTRFTRLFKADMHAVIDRLEEPDILLNQAIREMQEELQTTRLNLQGNMQRLQNIEQQIARQNSHIERFTSQLDLSFEAGNEPLSRSLLKQRLQHERALQQLVDKSALLRQQTETEQRSLVEREQQLAALQAQASLYQDQPSQSSQLDTHGLTQEITDEDVEIAFLTEKKRRQL